MRAIETAVVAGRRVWPRHLPAICLVISYVAFVLAMWAPLGPFNGMGYETQFALQSETSSVAGGFLFGDALRVHTSFFYQLSYLLSRLVGLPGAWLVYQSIYALLWLGRGILVYLIVRALFPAVPLFAFLVGALTIFHASDHTLNWVGQMNQFGFIFWMLLSVLLLIRAFDAPTRLLAACLTIVASFFCYMSLWSYEAQLPMIVTSVVLLALVHFRSWRRWLPIVTVYLVPAIVFVALNVQRYLGHSTNGIYQVTVLRSDLSIGSLVEDLVFNLKYALLFWHWSELMPSPFSQQHYVVVPLLAAAAFALGALWFARAMDTVALPSMRQLVICLGVGIVLLASSFPAFLILNSSRWLWRTQLLAGPPAALIMASLIGLGALALQTLLRGRRLENAVPRALLLASGAAIAYFGAWASLIDASFHYAMWTPVRGIMQSIISAAPRLSDGMTVVLLDVPKRWGYFGHNMWFDMAVKLGYPHSNVRGYYFLAGGEASPGNALAEQSEIDAGRLLVFRTRDGGAILQTSVPDELTERLHLKGQYDPARTIRPGPMAPEAFYRYVAFATPWVSVQGW